MGAILSPIPLSLLGSSCTVRVPADGKYGGEHADPVEVSHVRFVPRSEMERSGYVFADGATKGLLFIDAQNSEGAFEVPVGSLISIDGAPEASAANVVALPGFWGEVHHWEIEVE